MQRILCIEKMFGVNVRRLGGNKRKKGSEEGEEVKRQDVERIQRDGEKDMVLDMV